MGGKDMKFEGLSTIYVSQRDGDDNNLGVSPKADGRGNGPLKTVEGALILAYRLRVSGSRRPLTICITDEEYVISKPINIDGNALGVWRDNDCCSGITIKSCGNGRCRIAGGKKINGFKRDKFNGRECFSAYIPEVEKGEWEFTDLYVDGKRAKLTRYPQEGMLRCVETEVSGSKTETEHIEGSKWFIAHKEDLTGAEGIEDGIISYCHFWVDEHSPIESYDRETGKLTMKYKSRYLITNRYDEEHCPANFEYYIENLPGSFRNPGEWYLDKKTGMLYYMPENENQTPEGISVYAPVVSELLSIAGTACEKVKNIRFENLDFVCTGGDYESRVWVTGEETGEIYGCDGQSMANAPGAVNVKFAHCCSFENCSFENIGLHALAIGKGCDGIRVEKCRFYDIGAGGVKIFGGAYADEEDLYTHHNVISECDISYCGRRWAVGCGILANHTYCNEISGNEISFLDYSGISVGWVWGYANSITRDNIIRKNHIHHIGMGNLSDMGGIYLLGRQEGTIVSENVIHDVICKHYGGWGIYTDEGSSYITIEKNIVYRTSSQCFHQHYGCDNVVKNNIFAFGGDSVLRMSIDEMHTCVTVENNIFIADGAPIYTHREKDGISYGVVTKNNILWDVSGNASPYMYEDEKISLEEAQRLGFEDGSVIVDPLLCGDFNIRDDSPAYDMGFEKIRRKS